MALWADIDVTFRETIGRAIRMRCPLCGVGKPFSGLFTMDQSCGSCRFHYNREPGYFLGALYFSYFLGVVILLPTLVVCMFQGYAVGTACLIAFAQIAPLSPLIFRYSRGIWVAIDLVLSPAEVHEFGDAGSPE